LRRRRLLPLLLGCSLFAALGVAVPVAAHRDALAPRLATNGPAAAPAGVDPCPPESHRFLPGDGRYHTYTEMCEEVVAVAAAHPAIIQWSDLPTTSYQGRDILLAKISDNVALDEDEPEVFFNALTHAREHITVEQALAMLQWFADGYGVDSRITDIVNGREIWIVFMVNPDGGEFDLRDTADATDARYLSWRKNRQPNDGSYGTDVNRNFGYRWGCCGGSSSNPAAITYRGPSAWSSPEAVALRDFVLSRRVGGRQQIRIEVAFHAYGRQILYPYGYTTANVPSDMTDHDWRALSKLAIAMGSRNGYRATQTSSNYVASGTFGDWAYGRQRIMSFTFELHPRTAAEGGFYPPGSAIAAAIEENREALLYLIEQADCPYRAAGATYEQQDCGPFFDDLEMDRAWQVDPLGTDTATLGRWQRGDAAGTEAGGVKQRADAASGRGVLATGLLPGTSAGELDLDGVTTVQSPPIEVPPAARLTFRFTWAHDVLSSDADLLRARVVHDAGQRIVWLRRGQAADRDAVWGAASVDLAEFAGKTVRIRFEARDGDVDNLVEAAIDEVRVTVP